MNNKRKLSKLLKIIKKDGIGLGVHPDGPLYDVSGNNIYLKNFKNMNMAELAHEYGHALNFNNRPELLKKPIHRTIVNSRTFSKKALPFLAGGGVAAHALTKRNNPELAKKIRNYSMLGQVVGSAPILLEEGIASLKGAKTLKGLGDLQKKDKKIMFDNFLRGYASDLIPTLLAGGYYIGDALNERRKRKKEGDE